MKQVVKSLFILTLFFLAQGAFASVLINEIMYDLDGGDIDWVEVYNPDSTDVDLTTLKLLISNSTSNHSINSSSGSAVLHSGDYGVIVGSSVIANYTAKWGTTGNIFTSSYSFPNTGGKVEINNGDKLSPISTLTYESSHGASGNGKSLQKISGTWQESLPTPGKENVLSSSGSEDEHTEPPPAGSSDTESGSGSTPNGNTGGSNSSSAVSAVSNNKITTKPNYNNLIFSGIPIYFEAMTLGINGEKLIYGKYVWNFGDGMSLESKVADDGAISHTYYYPNDYVLTLEYYSNEHLWKPDATFQTTVKVLPASVYISNTGSISDFFVELANNSKYDVDVSLWRIVYGNQYFVLPKNTIILKNQKVSYSPKVTNFTYSESKDFMLYNANSDLIFDYEGNTKPNPNTKTITSKPSAKSSNIAASLSRGEEISGREDYGNFTNENLSARASTSLPKGYNRSSFIYGFGLLILLGVSGSSVFLLRRSKRLGKEDDFEVFDE